MTAELLTHIETQGAVCNLSDRAKWQLSGGDRVRYLNGQVTNDVRQASANAALYACVTDVKGRIVGDIYIHTAKDDLCFDAETDLRDILGPRLERYIIADDAELLDITNDWQLWHIFGAAALTNAAELPLAEGARRIANTRLGQPGLDIWVPRSTGDPHAFFTNSLSSEDFEKLRILRSIPRYPHELGPDTFPPEAGIEARAMSFTKGCYIGQEVLSRIKTTGKMPRALVRWQAAEQVHVGDAWFLEGNENAIGHATSCAFDPAHKRWIGLGYIKQANAPKDSELLVRNGQPRIGSIVEIFALLK